MSDKLSLILEGHSQETAMREVIRICLGADIALCDSVPEAFYVLSRARTQEQKICVFTEINAFGKQGKNEYVHTYDPEKNENQNMTNAVKTGFYRLFTELFNKTLPWGSQTGIRPALIATAMLKKHSAENAVKALMEEYSISQEKAELAVEVALAEAGLLEKKPLRGISLYIGIPFCPTRCLYCSFVSLPLTKQKKNVQPYVEKLCEEIAHVGKMIKQEGVTVDSIYIGGGTPTSLNEAQLQRLLSTIKENISLNELYEYTIEAGRADTISREKLEIIKSLTPSSLRVSINPQSMNNTVLHAIGRNHTAEDFSEAFNIARELGFTNINCDLIAGLPGESEEMFLSSLRSLCHLNPENITVHTMCIKRAATLKNSGFPVTSDREVCSMVSRGSEILRSFGYAPYYMYRQKDTLGGLENTGFAKPGTEGLYNIFMMEDISTVVGLGAGAVTKILHRDTGLIERVYNFKDPWEYVKSFDEIIRRKRIK